MTAIPLGRGAHAAAEFFDWWGRNLLAWLPASLRLPSPSAADALRLQLDEWQITAELRRGGSVKPRGRLPLEDGSAAALRALLAPLPAELPLLLSAPRFVLVKRLNLPAAARPDLAQMLAFEIDRETPFSEDEVWWTYFLAERAPEPGRIGVDLAMVPRQVLETPLAWLRAAGLEPGGIEIGTAAGVRVLPLDGKRRTARLGRRFVRFATCLLAAEIVLLFALPEIRQRAELRFVESEIDYYRGAAGLVAKLRDQLSQQRLPPEIAQGGRLAPGAVLRMVASATAAIPDSAFLANLQIDHERLAMRGSAISTAEVLSALKGDPVLGEPALAAPIAVAQSGGREEFDLVLRVAAPEAQP